MDTNQVSPVGSIPTLSVRELEADPHGVFGRYRPVTPVIAREGGGLIVLRAADVEGLMGDSRVRQTEVELPRQRGVADGALFDIFLNGMVTSNGPEHRRRRAPFTRTFAASLVTALRPVIRSEAEALIDRWRGERGADLVPGFAALLPARVISRMLGLPEGDIPYFTRLVYSVSRFLSFTFRPDELEGIKDDARALYEYVAVLVAGGRGVGRNDVLSGLLAAAAERGELTPVEVIVQIVTLIIGGTDTTRVAMASQVSLLLLHRAQWDALCAEPGLVRSAVAEGLRYEPSVASVGRVTLEEVVLGGTVIPAGQYLTLSTLSALRDEAVYDRPDLFDMHRADQRRPHMVFGGGPHRCLGEALARAELEESLSALTSRLPGLRLAGPPARVQGHMGIRRLDHLPVVW
ncbi:cytochrome P450 [Pararoseomonas sp. SCSIO 73927]|uniref:cytochrome P450 n=1 Tax=Pararoseomonas sp. SCSIO 73927 TaxID=3114537 RepID=UPI0030CDBEDF